MQYRALEEITQRLERKRVSFSALMPWRVRNILLVSSLYDSFTFQEDGSLTEMLFSEYLDLNLNYAPAITRASMAQEAIEKVKEDPPDLLITMPRVGDMDVFKFGHEVKQIAPQLPIILLAYDTRELALLQARENYTCIDRIFVWQGDVRLFLAIIKSVEDRMNALHDAETAGVKSILLIEDSVRFYSAYLPQLYTELVEQTQALMAEGVNRMQKLMRMRARPKIVLATSYNEAQELFELYREHVLGVITDARFPQDGKVNPSAGHEFTQLVKAEDPNIPVLVQSSEKQNRSMALSQGAAFINKRSRTLLHEVRKFLQTHLGFGDFVFKHPDGSEIARARDLNGLARQLQTIPEESLIHHATRNDFSTWLMARTEFDLAKALRPITTDEFETAVAMREFLLSAINTYRYETRAGLVAEFSTESFDPRCCLTRIGQGSLGGKGRGLAFVDSLMNAFHIERHIPDVRIFVPPSAVVATGVFDAFMEENHLADVALCESNDEQVREAFLAAPLPQDAMAALRTFLGSTTYPLAVRSSSLLEDSSHQPFAGIYQTYMLPNNHEDPQVRLEELSHAIRLVYASTYYADSKSYIDSTPNRLEEEKMAVVIQQIVGRQHDNYFYPDIAGVARSHDYYPMNDMKADDGVASIALGLGRTVVDGERCVRFSPVEPQRLYQFSSTKEYLRNSQREFYALDLTVPGLHPTADTSPAQKTVHQPDANLVKLGIDDAMKHETLAPVGSVYSPENDAVYEGVYRQGVKLITMAGILSGDYLQLPE
ncbi:PEP/pyruvate-binding domain-containing protein, partial [Candidatus Eisenbacteria bacterium]